MSRVICPNCGYRLFQLMGAERLAAAVNIMVKQGHIDARSIAGDELLNYYQGDRAAPEIPSAADSWRVLNGEYE